MYLQLAEGENNGNYSALAESSVLDNYVFIPAGFLPEFQKDTYVRADYFTKYDTATADAIINALAAYQSQGLNEGLVQGALNFIPGVGPIASKGLGIAKNLIAARQAKVQAGTAKPIGKPGGLLDKLRQKIQTTKAAPAQDQQQQDQEQQEQQKNFFTNPFGATVQTGQGQFNVGFNPAQQPGAPGTFWQKYKTPLLIGGGLLAVGGLYLLMKKKK